MERRKYMKKMFTVVLAILVVGAIGARSARAGGSGAEAFEKMKALVGDWQTETSANGKATLHLELASGGTALLEKFHMEENGKPVDMITLYYLDGDQLRLTHYCMAGNQPTMAGTYDPAMKTIKFNFLSVSNLKTPDTGHMHHGLYTFIDNDHFRTNWTFWKDQKDSFTEDATYVRVK
jgi:hypothetical protein